MARTKVLDDLFRVSKPIIGMVHLRPLPGAPRYRQDRGDAIVAAAVRDARLLRDGGVEGIMVENMGDVPFAKPEDIGPEVVAFLAVAARSVREATSLPVGVNCLANGVVQAIAAAVASGAKWVRANQWANAYVADEGLVEAAAPRALRYRTAIGAAGLRVFADVHVKHGSHFLVSDRSLEEQARDVAFFDADCLIVTGTRTAVPPEVQTVQRVRRTVELPVLIGSGLNVENTSSLLEAADGAIVGSSLKRHGDWSQPVEAKRVAALMAAVRHLRTRV